MNIQVNWDDNEKLAIRYDFREYWDWIEFAWANERAFNLMQSVTHEVSIVLNLKDSMNIPTGALAAVQQMLSMAPHNLGIIIAVHCDRSTKYALSMLSKFDPSLAQLITIEDTLDDAREAIWYYWKIMAG